MTTKSGIKRILTVGERVNYIAAAVLLIIFIWKFLPPFSSLLEVTLMNQTFRIFAGLFFILYGLLFSYRFRYGRIVELVLLSVSLLMIWDSHPIAVTKAVKYPCYNPDSTITIYSHNIRGRCPQDNGLIDIVSRLEPDLVVLQEISESRFIEITASMAAMGYLGFHAPSERITLTYALFSRLPVRNQRVEIIPGTDWSPVWPVQAAEFQFLGRWIKVFSLHLNAVFYPNERLYRRLSKQSATGKQLEAVLSMASADTLPTLICGDFNQTPTSKYLRPLRKNYTDAWRAGGRGFGATWHNRFPWFRIDFVYCSREFEVLSCSVVKNKFSDHRGLLTVIAFK